MEFNQKMFVSCETIQLLLLFANKINIVYTMCTCNMEIINV